MSVPIAAEAPRTIMIPPKEASGADPLHDELAKIWTDHVIGKSICDKADVINGYGWAVSGPLQWVYDYLTRKIENASSEAFGAVLDRLGQMTIDEQAALITAHKQRHGVKPSTETGARPISQS